MFKDIILYAPGSRVDDVLFNMSHQFVHGNVPEHAHSECIEITIITNGRCTHHADGKSVIMGKGDVGVTLLDGIHSMTECRDMELFTFSCSGKLESMTGFNLNLLFGMRELFSGSGETKIFHLNSVEFTDTYRMINFLEKLHGDGDGTASLKGELRSGFAILLCLLAQAYSRTLQSENVHSRLEKILHYIDEHYCEDIELSHLAKISFLSVSQLIRSFKQNFGTTPINYQLQLRADEACRLLQQTVLPISEISYRTGFCDCAYFSKFFSKKFGCSPRNFRKRTRMESSC